MFYPRLFNTQFNAAFDELSKIHDALMDASNSGYLQLHTDDEYTYNLLTNPKEYYSVGMYLSLDANEPTDAYRVGPSPINEEDDFIIEDSAGRNIPIQWGDIDSLITTLQELKEERYDTILKAKEVQDSLHQERINELEAELNKLKKVA